MSRRSFLLPNVRVRFRLFVIFDFLAFPTIRVRRSPSSSSPPSSILNSISSSPIQGFARNSQFLAHRHFSGALFSLRVHVAVNRPNRTYVWSYSAWDCVCFCMMAFLYCGTLFGGDLVFTHSFIGVCFALFRDIFATSCFRRHNFWRICAPWLAGSGFTGLIEKFSCS